MTTALRGVGSPNFAMAPAWRQIGLVTLLALSSIGPSAQDSESEDHGQPNRDEGEVRRAANEQIARLLAER